MAKRSSPGLLVIYKYFYTSVHLVNVLRVAPHVTSRGGPCVRQCKDVTNGAYRCFILMYFVMTPGLVVNCYQR